MQPGEVTVQRAEREFGLDEEDSKWVSKNMMECAIEEGKAGSGHCFQKCQNLKFPTAATKGKLDNRQREKDGEGGGAQGRASSLGETHHNTHIQKAVSSLSHKRSQSVQLYHYKLDINPL